MVNPQHRRKARGRALEFLFSLEFTRYEWRKSLEEFWETFDAKPGVREYTDMLVEGVKTHAKELDGHIDSALTNWSPERVGRIERNVLRIALFEIVHCTDVPQAVAINEAVEVARAYGTDESPGFVNAVLDRLKDSSFAASGE